ncbi:SWI/SNF complex subunit SWI3A isoform X1 [Prosopis cineraria]|uniref:SWI/SNF complex subunit SWI3A isoform X1 n=1 Tax=Prosopis cineraria TaxID=364024 RepID=UPI002410259F|nr:SWI/SNF complex subunit SWI3A isoform X1 [Prosopis cineraria]XP_054813021.1 SWI/SNF complex subunit SWI3A isoform X1 [Prosopis cineraria]
MEASQDPNSNPSGIDDSELELYTIPSHSRWFQWDEIHETEKTSLKEFFDGTSISRTPKVYKEYRDFIISKYREEPSKRLTFTEVRKSLVGDVSLLRKVFLFLEKWGLVNYGASSNDSGENLIPEGDEKCKVKIEEGAPNGIRVVAMPNSLKPISVPNSKISGNAVGSGLKLPPLASYSDVYRDMTRQKELACGICSNKCDSCHYKSTQDNFIVCAKCFENGKYGEKRSSGDFKLIQSNEDGGKHEAVWTEGEILLLLESVLKHGDDWELVAQNVQTKTKLDCISKLIELPFGEFMLGSAHRNGNSNSAHGIVNSAKQVQSSSSDHQETSKTEDQIPEHKDETETNGDVVKESPSKRQCVATPAISDSGSSLMKQVGLISTVVDPHITAAAADAAIMALCDENMCPREMFDVDEDYASSQSGLNTLNGYSARVLEGEGSDVERSIHSDMHERSPKNDDIPMTLRIRAAIATALGAAAARAKMLADQEDREIEHLVATIIEAQIEKLQRKTKHFEELELLMEKEHAEMEELKNSVLTERIDVLQKTFSAGVPRWKDYPSGNGKH